MCIRDRDTTDRFASQATPVSYTHLDVYKRQGYDRSLREPGHPCLLYTSRCV
nr:hypothetical protein [Pseudomonas sp. HS-2]